MKEYLNVDLTHKKKEKDDLLIYFKSYVSVISASNQTQRYTSAVFSLSSMFRPKAVSHFESCAVPLKAFRGLSCVVWASGLAREKGLLAHCLMGLWEKEKEAGDDGWEIGKNSTQTKRQAYRIQLSIQTTHVSYGQSKTASTQTTSTLARRKIPKRVPHG